MIRFVVLSTTQMIHLTWRSRTEEQPTWCKRCLFQTDVGLNNYISLTQIPGILSPCLSLVFAFYNLPLSSFTTLCNRFSLSCVLISDEHVTNVLACVYPLLVS